MKELKFDKNGLIPAIIQDYKTKKVLMLAYMNKTSLRKTLNSGKTCFWSRSRKKFWVKGETSGNFQFIKDIYYDCDSDTLLIRVRQVGNACHTGRHSCFYRKLKCTR
ncbi:MAG: phosphoribosyl-AMP cyclohydrolase [Candidatus Omnitrophota bacterium]|nr:phosphoribosyl-AMP cyclohydrolase [Candidatus Omnitrophota bacterium]